jgi:AraC-like DNA-binding protein
MFALYASQRNWLSLRLPIGPFQTPVVAAVSWAAFEALAAEAECCLVEVAPEQPAPVLDGLAALGRARPDAALVFITERRLPPAIHRLGVSVRPPLDPRRLWLASQIACTRSVLRAAAADATRAVCLPPLARAALHAALAADPPLRTVSDVADAVRSSRRHLSRAWASWHGTAGPAATMPEVLEWLLLLRGVLARTAAPCWEDVARRFGVHRHTLTRIARDLAQCQLRSLTVDALPRLRPAFRAAVVAPLLGRPAGDRDVRASVCSDGCRDRAR